MKPPPAPTMPDRKPMVPPAASWPAVPGIWRDGAGFLLRSICQAEKPTNRAKNTARNPPLSRANTPRLAARLPSTMPGARRCTRSQRTAPRWWWARTLEREVNTMVAMEVAIAILTARPGSTPCLLRMWVRKGTSTMPPPMPSRPARKPVPRPSRASSAIKSRSMGMGRERGARAWVARRRNRCLQMPPGRHPEPGVQGGEGNLTLGSSDARRSRSSGNVPSPGSKSIGSRKLNPAALQTLPL